MKNISHERRRRARAPAPSTASRHIPTERIFRLDDGYIALYHTPSGHALDALEHYAALGAAYHLTIVLDAPRDAAEWLTAQCARVAQAFDRVLVCGSDHAGIAGAAEAAVRFVRAVRRAGRIECQRVADPHRALRHCIDGLLPGEVIAYCCDAFESACEILDEYGAAAAREIPRVRRPVSLNVAQAVAPGAALLAAAHARRA